VGAETVGARLLLSGKDAFVADAQASAAAIDEITAAADRGAAAMDRMAGASARIRDVSLETDGLAASTAASTDASKAKTAASEDEAVAAGAVAGKTKEATAALKEHKSTLDSLAGNSIIKGTALFGTGALAATAYESIKEYTKFNQLVTQSAVDAGVPKGDLKKVQSDLIGMSRQYGVNVNDLANSWYRVASAMSGGHTTLKQMLALTKDAAKLDVLFNVPAGNQTEQLSRIMGGLMNAHLQGAKTPDQIMALANASVGRGDIRGPDLISALGKSLPAAKALNVSLPDMTAWIDTLTKLNMQGSQAGTLIAHSVQQLGPGVSEQGRKAEEMIGIDPSGKDSLTNLIQTKGISYTVDYLTNAMKKFNPTSYYPKFGTNDPGAQSALAQLTAWGIADPATQAAFQSGTMDKQQQHDIQLALLAKIFGGAKSALPMLALTSNEQGYSDLISSINKASTPAALRQSFQTAMSTPGRQMQIAEANIKATGIGIGQMLTPDAVHAFHAFADVAKYLSDHADVLKGILAAFTAFVGTSMLVYGAEKTQKLVTSIKYLSDASGLTRVLFGSTTALTTPAATMQTAADTMLTAADKMSTAGLEGGVGGAAKGGVAGAAGGAEAGGIAGAEAGGEVAAGEAGAASVLETIGLTSLIFSPATVAAAAIAASFYGAAYLSKRSGANSNLNYLLGHNITINGRVFISTEQLSIAQRTAPPTPTPGLSKAHGGSGAPSQVVYPGPNGTWHAPPHGSPGTPPPIGPWSPRGFFPIQKVNLSGALKQEVSEAHKTISLGARDILNGAQIPRSELAVNEAKAAGEVQKKAAAELSEAARLHKQAAEETQKAVTETGKASEKSNKAAEAHQKAAQQHANAAAQLAGAAQSINSAASKLGNIKIQATISATALATATTTQAANALARS
jgi:TP901 family phage tail tape measure protein